MDHEPNVIQRLPALAAAHRHRSIVILRLQNCAAVRAEAGFLISRYRVEAKGDSKQSAAMNSYARTVAEQRLRTLKGGDTLPALRQYQRNLKSPIEINPDVLDKEASLSPSKRRAIGDWLRRNPQLGSFYGEKVSEVWQQELTRTDQQFRQLSEQFDAALNQARQKAGARMFEEAAQQSQAALRIDPENTEAQTLYHSIYRNWTMAKCDKLLESFAEIRGRVAAEAQLYETGQFSESVIQQSEADLNQAQIQIDEFRAWSSPNPDGRQTLAERETEVRQAETQLEGLRSTAWAQKIWLLRRQHHYWAAYQLFISATGLKELDLGRNQKHLLLDYETPALHQRLREAYESMLPEGMSFYIHNAAQAAEGQGANGLSLVLCRMAQELLNYSQAQQMQLAPGTEDLRASLNLSLGKAQKALKTALTRQLIIKDFQSWSDVIYARGDIGHELATHIYDQWLKRYPAEAPTETPLPFWMLEVKREAQITNSFDYVLGGTVAKCYSDTLPPKELNVDRLEIGLEPQEVPNPDPKMAKKFPTVFEQELWIYERRVSQYAKKAIISADITVSIASKVNPCATISHEFDDVREKLPGIHLMDQGIENHALNYKQKRSPHRGGLKVDKLPPNKIAELSSDREIEAALIDFATGQVMTNLEILAATFPLNNLFQDGLRNEDKPVQAAEGFGRCLEYCSQLATLDKNLAARTGNDWLTWREAMADRIAGLKKEQWRNADPGLTSKVDQVWELAVAAAIKAADQMFRENGNR